jgi:hypothetical protein
VKHEKIILYFSSQSYFPRADDVGVGKGLENFLVNRKTIESFFQTEQTQTREQKVEERKCLKLLQT